MSINISNTEKTMKGNKHKKTRNASITIRIDDVAKSQFEDICSDMGLTISSAVSAFVDKVISLKAMPFTTNNYKRKRKLGIAEGKYDIPDDIDSLNDEIAEMFGV